MKRKHTSIIAGLASSLILAGSLFAAQPQEKPMPDPAAPAKESPIGMEKARAIALEKVPGGEVAFEELKRDHDVLLYAFDIEVKGKKGVEVVSVGATSGEVLSVKHKSASAMRRDAKAKRLRRS